MAALCAAVLGLFRILDRGGGEFFVPSPVIGGLTWSDSRVAAPIAVMLEPRSVWYYDVFWLQYTLRNIQIKTGLVAHSSTLSIFYNSSLFIYML